MGSIFGIVTVVLITLKVTDQIDWSWWAVLSPLWLPTVIVFTIALVGVALESLFGKNDD